MNQPAPIAEDFETSARSLPDFWRRIIGLPAGRRQWLVALTLALVLAVGVVDFATGFEISWLTFYLLPVCLAVVALGWRFGVVTAVVSVATWLAGDIAAGAHYPNPLVPAWNALIALCSFLVVVALFSSLLALHRDLDERVRRRTAALTAEIAERERLEKVILELSERERRSLGRDLHDGLGQHLTGTSLTGQLLAEKLQAREAGEAEDARRLVGLIEDAIEQTRRLAKGLVLAEIGPEGLVGALGELAAATRESARVACDLRSDGPVRLEDGGAVHLYRIAQEAVSNALRHGHAQRIEIDLTAAAGGITLTVRDDGMGLPPPEARGEGLGMRIMAHRATIIGAGFKIEPRAGGGTVVTCHLPRADR